MTSAHDRTAGAPRAARRWAKTNETRGAILAAAREVFLDHGFTSATVSDVVEKSGCSVGSIYHHFGGKTELYVALCVEYQDTLHDASARAVQAARSAGERDPVELFVAGSRGYLEQAWIDQDLARLVLSGDHPPDHDVWRRERGRVWIHENGLLLRAADGPAGRVLVAALTSIVGEGARLVSVTDSRREAFEIIDAVLSLVRKVAG